MKRGMSLYDAFISYSHAGDKPVAQALQSVVQTLGKPWWRRRALHVFRDDTSLSATPHLWPDIETALDASRFLVLIASPQAAASPWVDKEVAHWLLTKSPETILIVLTAGTLGWDMRGGDFLWDASTPLPPALRRRFRSEPKWVDLTAYRAANPKAAARNPDFQTRAADIAAAVQGVPKEDLLSDELRQQRRALNTAYMAAAALAVLAAVSIFETIKANRERNRAERVLEQGTKTANNLVLDLARRFRGQSGIPQQFIIDVLGQARELAEDLAKVGGERPDLLQSQANAQAELAKTLLAQGDADAALAAADKAVAVFSKLVAGAKRGVDQTSMRNGLGVAHDRRGDALFEMRRRPDALAAYQQSFNIFEQLAGGAAGNPGDNQNLAVAHEKIAEVLRSEGNAEAALAAYRQSLRLREQMAAAQPGNAEWQQAKSVSHAKVGEMLMALGQKAEAQAEYEKNLEIAQRLAVAAPNQSDRQRDLALSYRRLGKFFSDQARNSEAIAYYRRDLAIVEALAAADPARTQWQQDWATSADRLGDALMKSRNTPEALDRFRQSLAVIAKVAARDPGRTGWQHDLAVAHKKVGDALRTGKRGIDALGQYQLSLNLRKQPAMLAQAQPEWDTELAQTYQHMSDLLLEDNAPVAALAVARERVATFTMLQDTYGNRTKPLAGALGSQGWYALFTRAFADALSACDAALALTPEQLWLRANRAHALMFRGEAAAARAEYLAHKGKRIPDLGDWNASVRGDFAIFRKAGLLHPLMDEVEQALAK